MNSATCILSSCIVCLLAVAVAFAGCTGTEKPANQTPQPTPVGTAVPAGYFVVTEEQNNATISVNQSNVITVKLQENPSTGYKWNLTTTPGLKVMSDIYVPSDTTGKVVGSGGTHIWDISAITKGGQKIEGVYNRSWEPLTGNETRFLMTIVVN